MGGPFEATAGPFKEKILGRTVKVGPFKIKTPEYEVIVGPFPLNAAGIKPIIKGQLIKGLTVYPKSILPGQSGFLGTDALRRMFVDAAIGAVPLVNPWLTALLNFFAEGGLVRGIISWRRSGRSWKRRPASARPCSRTRTKARSVDWPACRKLKRGSPSGTAVVVGKLRRRRVWAMITVSLSSVESWRPCQMKLFLLQRVG